MQMNPPLAMWIRKLGLTLLVERAESGAPFTAPDELKPLLLVIEFGHGKSLALKSIPWATLNCR
jgi:hypothetical protein